MRECCCLKTTTVRPGLEPRRSSTSQRGIETQGWRCGLVAACIAVGDWWCARMLRLENNIIPPGLDHEDRVLRNVASGRGDRTLLGRSNDLTALVPTAQETSCESFDHPSVSLADRSGRTARFQPTTTLPSLADGTNLSGSEPASPRPTEPPELWARWLGVPTGLSYRAAQRRRYNRHSHQASAGEKKFCAGANFWWRRHDARAKNAITPANRR